jgi:dTDP-4-dehydrorhamnose 3,5-epimerase
VRVPRRGRSILSAVPETRDFSAERTAIDGLWLISMKEVTDARGTVREFYRESAFLEAGMPSLGPFLQINVTETRPGALRGLHAEDMDKLVAVVSGEAFGAYVDTRRHSPTYGTVVTLRLTKGTQVLVPRGVGNGFQVVSPEPAQYVYCFDHEWVPGMAGAAVNPLDPALRIDWPLPIDLDDPAQISAKDRAQPMLADAS